MLSDDALAHVFHFAAADAASVLAARRVSKHVKGAVERAVNSISPFPWRGTTDAVVLLRLLFHLWTTRLRALPGTVLRANVRALGAEQHVVLFTAAYVVSRIVCAEDRAYLRFSLVSFVHGRLAQQYDADAVASVTAHLFGAWCA
jgi:hypothetical protein